MQSWRNVFAYAKELHHAQHATQHQYVLIYIDLLFFIRSMRFQSNLFHFHSAKKNLLEMPNATQLNHRMNRPSAIPKDGSCNANWLLIISLNILSYSINCQGDLCICECLLHSQEFVHIWRNSMNSWDSHCL